MGNRPPDNLDDVLTGTTMKVYRFLMKAGKPIGPRELQKQLGLSSPSVAAFHLDKLERTGLAMKNDQGEYSVNVIYLKHYVRLRRYLIPRYMFHATLATFLLVGWLVVFLTPNFRAAVRDPVPAFSSALILVFAYGVIVTLILVALFWYETIGIMRKERI
ncbi:MAG: hypothetical protein ACYC7D_13640 [Nitrososphaerales archaeon]